jgi:hypothetical protein
MRNITWHCGPTLVRYSGGLKVVYVKFRTAFIQGFCNSYRMATSPEERVRHLCSLIDTAHGEELEKAILDLRCAITALIENAHNVSTYNLINFPVAMDKRKKA